jgi:hypothetical protein
MKYKLVCDTCNSTIRMTLSYGDGYHFCDHRCETKFQGTDRRASAVRVINPDE